MSKIVRVENLQLKLATAWPCCTLPVCGGISDANLRNLKSAGQRRGSPEKTHFSSHNEISRYKNGRQSFHR